MGRLPDEGRSAPASQGGSAVGTGVEAVVEVEVGWISMQADYSKQLAEIATALRQSTPWWQNPWILAGFSAMLGVIGGFVGQILQNIYHRRVVRRTLLRICYGYVGQLLASLDAIQSSSPQFSPVHDEAVRLLLPPIPDEYIKSHLDVYATLEESVVFDTTIALGKRLLSPPEGYTFINAAIETIVQQFVMERLTVDKMGQARSREELETFSALLAKYEPDVRKQYGKESGDTPSK